MVNLMLAVEVEFDIAIPQSEITPENFESLELHPSGGTGSKRNCSACGAELPPPVPNQTSSLRGSRRGLRKSAPRRALRTWPARPRRGRTSTTRRTSSRASRDPGGNTLSTASGESLHHRPTVRDELRAHALRSPRRCARREPQGRASPPRPATETAAAEEAPRPLDAVR